MMMTTDMASIVAEAHPVPQKNTTPPPDTSFVIAKSDEDSNALESSVGTEINAPDGGRAAWMQVVGGFFVWMNTL